MDLYWNSNNANAEEQSFVWYLPFRAKDSLMILREAMASGG